MLYGVGPLAEEAENFLKLLQEIASPAKPTQVMTSKQKWLEKLFSINSIHVFGGKRL